MKNYTDQEIKEMFPGPNGPDGDPVAHIVPRVRTMRVMTDPPPKDAHNGFFDDVIKGEIKIKYNRQVGTNQATLEPIYNIKQYRIGPFQPGQMIRTDKIKGASKEIPPCELIRILLNHDSHKDENENILVFDVVPIDKAQYELDGDYKRKPGRPKKEVETEA